MSVSVSSLQGGRPLQASFSDNFNRVNANSLGSNWLRLLGGNDTGTLNSWGGGATIVTNQCVIAGAGENNPNATLKTAWVPVPVLNSRFFNAQNVFAQATFIAFAGTIGCALGLRYNQSAEAGPITQPNGQDCYLAIINGRLDKTTNGGAQTVIGANTVAIVGGNVIRIECRNSGTQTNIRTLVNGAEVNNVTELAASFPIQRGWPCFNLLSVGGAPPTGSTMTWDDFSCGLL